MPDWLIVVILGVIEGITEFLPISSTGHLLIAQRWLHHGQSDLFNALIQCGSVLAVLAVFAPRVKELALTWRQAESRQYILKLCLAFFITAVGGLVLHALDFELPEKAAPVAWAILIGGILMLVVERWLRGKPLRSEMLWTAAAAGGVAQLVAAVFPGTSRSGATILVALAFGIQRPLAVEFSFLLGVPTLLAAGVLKLYSAHKDGSLGAENWPLVLLGTAVGAIMAFLAVKWLLRYTQSHTFTIFGWYRIVLGVLILLWLT